MSKRLTATEKWLDPWFCALTESQKLFWVFLLDNCDHAGIWQVNWPLVKFHIPSFKFDDSVFGTRIVKISDEKWHIPKFVSFQYGKLNGDNRLHSSVLEHLKKEGLSKGLGRSYKAPKDKRKDKDKEKEKEGEVVEGIKPLTDIQKVITVYKLACGFARDDKKWDRTFFARYTRVAKELIEFMGSWKDAADCVQDTVEKIRKWNPEATISIDTILSKHAAEWKKNKQEKEPEHGTISV